MKRIAILAACVGLSMGAYAIPFEVPGMGEDIPKNGTGTGGGNGNSPGDDFTRLQSVINAWNAAHPADQLPNPVSAGDFVGNNKNDQFKNSGLGGFQYAVIHYGAGDGGSPGGGVEIWDLDGASSFTFPKMGSGTNGRGGFSSIVLFDALQVPDGGTTVLLLGAALSGLGLVRRKVK